MGFLKNIFGAGSSENVICPRCLNNIDVKRDEIAPCKVCSFELPIRYVQNFKYAPPLFVQVFGWTAHGKTVFLQALRLMLLDMGKMWDGYTQQSITQLDMEHDRNLRTHLAKGMMPSPTTMRDRAPEEVFIMQLNDMAYWGSRWLIMMDHAGEAFKSMDVNIRTMPFLLKSPTTFMLLSIPKMKHDSMGETMDQLLSIYIETMLRNKVSFKEKRRELVIILTMADDIPELPPELRQYLRSDAMWNQLRTPGRHTLSTDDMRKYVQGMHTVDQQIREWLRYDNDGAPGGANLVGLLDREGIAARFSAISATGGPVPETGEPFPISPRRVLDPFFWALEFQRK